MGLGNLIAALVDKYHVVSPDDPGYGASSVTTVYKFEYTFDNLSRIIEKFTERIGLQAFSIYLLDCGAPVGFRLSLRQPERVAFA